MLSLPVDDQELDAVLAESAGMPFVRYPDSINTNHERR